VAKTQDIKRRIRSVKNTMQLTKAMKMVSAAKLRRAQEKMMAARPYAERSRDVLASLAARVDPDTNPLLRGHGDRKIEVILMTSDRGLCGAFNAHNMRHVEDFARGLRTAEVGITAVGKKGREYFTRRRFTILRAWNDAFRQVQFAFAKELAAGIVERYLAKESDKVYLAHNEFKSAIQAKPVIRQLLPVEPEAAEPGQHVDEYQFEPDAASLLADLLPHYIEVQVYQAMLESAAAEHAARMSAMENATSNAGELIESLTLKMNRIRQASITTEIIEVVSGAEALG
jgi:F-type H+-transporting ATPase subunit gamma